MALSLVRATGGAGGLVLFPLTTVTTPKAMPATARIGMRYLRIIICVWLLFAVSVEFRRRIDDSFDVTVIKFCDAVGKIKNACVVRDDD